MLEQLLAQANLPAAIYTHIPYCKSKCTYCDFGTTVAAQTAEKLTSYTEKVIIQIEQLGRIYSQLRTKKAQQKSPNDPLASTTSTVPTLYIGGGTPNWLGVERLTNIVQSLQTNFNPNRSKTEFTVELNPDSTDTELLQSLHEYGVNRLSIGIQSFNEDELTAVGRAHSRQQAVDTIRQASEHFNNISIDLIIGLPNQTTESWKDTLREALCFVKSGVITHISIYPLSLDGDTPLSKSVQHGVTTLPDQSNMDYAVEMWQLADKALQTEGFEHYEISSWAKPGYRSQHNLHYWDGSTYWGIGDGASGMLNLPQKRVRYMNDIIEEELTLAEAAKEDVILAFRCIDGVQKSQLVKLYEYYPAAVDVIEKLSNTELIVPTDTGFRASSRGWLLGNELFGAIWNLV